MSDSLTLRPYTGVHVLQLHNTKMWTFILVASNIAGVVLLLLMVASSRGAIVLALVAGLSILLIANAILVPITIVQLRKRLTLDFAAGTLTTGGITYPAVELSALIQTTRNYAGVAHLLTFEYLRGTVEVQVDGFPPTPATRARNAALLGFIWQCLPVPESHAQHLGKELTLVRHLIGKQEASALLSDRFLPVP